MAKKAEKDNALVPANQEAPAWLAPAEEGATVAGLENARPSDMLMPRLILMQALSPAVVEGDRRPGDVVNSLTGELMFEASETRKFIPVFHYLEWIEWGDREKNEGIKDRSLDPKGALARMAAEGVKIKNDAGKERMRVTEYHNFVALFPGHSMVQPIVIGCCRTNHKKGKALITLAKYRGRFDLFSGLYTIGTEDEKNSKNQQYKVYRFENAGFVEQEQYAVAKKLYEGVREAFSERRLRVDDEDVKVADGTEVNETEM